MTGTGTLFINLGATLGAIIALGVLLHRAFGKRIDDLKVDQAALRTEVKADHKALETAVGALKDDIGGVRIKLAEVRTEIQGVRTEIQEVRTEIQEVRTDIAKTQGKTNERIARLEGSAPGTRAAEPAPEPAG